MVYVVVINQPSSDKISKIGMIFQNSIFNSVLPVILNVLQQLLKLPGLDCEESQHACEEEEEGVDPPLERDEEGGGGDQGWGQAVGEKVGH